MFLVLDPFPIAGLQGYKFPRIEPDQLWAEYLRSPKVTSFPELNLISCGRNVCDHPGLQVSQNWTWSTVGGMSAITQGYKFPRIEPDQLWAEYLRSSRVTSFTELNLINCGQNVCDHPGKLRRADSTLKTNERSIQRNRHLLHNCALWSQLAQIIGKTSLLDFTSIKRTEQFQRTNVHIKRSVRFCIIYGFRPDREG